MAYGESDNRARRLSAAAAALAIQAGVLAALVSGLAVRFFEHDDATVSAVAIPAPKPSPPPDIPPPRKAGKPEPAGKAGSARPLEAPKAAIPRKAPAAASTAQSGNAASSAPGENGSGSGASGAGAATGGGGGGGTRARRSGGALSDRDYPGAAARVRAAGTVFIRFRIGSDGRVHDCRVTRSSGFAVLDSTTCRLVEQRFRYIPARDGTGRAVDDSASTSFTWGPKN